MTMWTIGEVARQTGLRPSTIRYYESIALIPKPGRQNGRRIYTPELLQRLVMIQGARKAGFSIAELRILLHGFTPRTAPAARWRKLAAQRLETIQQQMAQLKAQEQLAQRFLNCQCRTLKDCGQALASVSVE